MVNSEKLKEKIDETGVSISHLARKSGMTRESFYNKMNNETEFKVSEMLKISKALNISFEEREEIFFADDVN